MQLYGVLKAIKDIARAIKDTKDSLNADMSITCASSRVTKWTNVAFEKSQDYQVNYKRHFQLNK